MSLFSCVIVAGERRSDFQLDIALYCKAAQRREDGSLRILTAKALRQLVLPPSLALVMHVLGCDSNLDVSPLFQSHFFTMFIGQRIFNTEDLI